MLTEEKIKLAAQKWAIDEKKKWPHLSAPEFIAGAKWAKEILERRIDELADETDTQRKVIEQLRSENERLLDVIARLTNHIEEMQSALEK